VASEKQKKRESKERRKGGNPLKKEKKSDREEYREGKLKRKRSRVKRTRNSEPKRSSKECTFCIRGQQEEGRSKEKNKS